MLNEVDVRGQCKVVKIIYYEVEILTNEIEVMHSNIRMKKRINIVHSSQ